jgi:hypothetical protein
MRGEHLGQQLRQTLVVLRLVPFDERLGEHQVRFALVRRLRDRELARRDRGIPVAVVHGEARAIAEERELVPLLEVAVVDVGVVDERVEQLLLQPALLAHELEALRLASLQLVVEPSRLRAIDAEAPARAQHARVPLDLDDGERREQELLRHVPELLLILDVLLARVEVLEDREERLPRLEDLRRHAAVVLAGDLLHVRVERVLVLEPLVDPVDHADGGVDVVRGRPARRA